MLNKSLHAAVFVAGLVLVAWVGAGTLGSHPLALAVLALIAAGYLAGGLELRRYRQATATLQRALDELPAPADPADGDDGRLDGWLGRLHCSLRSAVRLRIEGERAPLPAPTLTPYLVGLLVLLGMLGTLLGMTVTLRGTGLALESASDLQAIRAAIAAPVAGLGFAFGTSIAGIAASAMLGLLAALCRRERAAAVQRLDAAAAGALRTHSRAYRHERRRAQAFELLQRQTETMPALVAQLQSAMAALERHSDSAHERQLERQDAFHQRSEAAYARLAESFERSLKDSVGEGARAAGAALQPVADATMAALAREGAALHERVGSAVQQQLDGLAAGFAGAAGAAAEGWSRVLADHRGGNEALLRELRGALEGFAGTFERGAAGLLKDVSTQLEASHGRSAQTWDEAQARQGDANQALADRHQQALGGAAAAFEQHAAALVAVVERSHADLQDALQSRDRERLSAWTESFGAMSAALGERWEQSQTLTAQRQQDICATLARTADEMSAQAQAHARDTVAEIERLVDAAAQAPKAAAGVVAGFQTHAAELVGIVRDSHAQLHAALESRDRERLAMWTEAFGAMTAELGQRWQQAGEAVAGRQLEVCDTLARTAQEVSAQSQAQSRDTIAEISRLVDAAAQAPKAAAEVVAELRQKLSDSMVRDTAMLEERNRLLATLETLLDAVNHASGEQRAAVDALVASSAELLERAGARLNERVEADAGKLDAAAAQLGAGAVEVASLGDAFAALVQQFGDTHERLADRLQGVEVALDKSLARSDEQLAYYVAQAREVVDLSVLSQKQIIDELQRVADGQAAAHGGPGAQAA
ncbi:protein of unknown function [Lysobacter sp. yr284]|uniref:DUF802 domain-containing protein n=1 Tax=Lysobacter sp. yr284 TaxID=1761791 RepID=UPI0008972665|nr:DUF802 domain-containing protein [Lysobacter sp. yr284]SDY79892.1 protein of unknown function [Lysobacter sp. yr284]